MLKNKFLHEKIEQRFDGSKRKAFRALSVDEDMALHMAMYGKVKGPVRNQLLWMRGQPRFWLRWNGSLKTMVEINDG